MTVTRLRDTSQEGGHSSDSDVEERPPRRDLHADTATTGTTSQQLRRVPGLVTIKARLPEFRPLLNYRTYRDRLGFQGQKQLPPFSDPLKSEGRQGLYSLSVDGRSERKEGILEDSMG